MCVKDTSLEAQPGSRLVKVVDEKGSEVDRHALLQTERTLLCEVRFRQQLLQETARQQQTGPLPAPDGSVHRRAQSDN